MTKRPWSEVSSNEGLWKAAKESVDFHVAEEGSANGKEVCQLGATVVAADEVPAEPVVITERPLGESDVASVDKEGEHPFWALLKLDGYSSW